MSLYSVLDSSSSPTVSSKKGPILTPNAIIGKRIDLNPGLVVLELIPDGWNFPRFQAGQFIKVGLKVSHDDVDHVDMASFPVPTNKSLQRAYSIISSPSQTNSVEILLNLVPDGEFTPSMWRLEPGSRVYVDPKIRGKFTTDGVNRDSNVLLIATGTGIAPYRSMILDHLNNTPVWKDVKLIHSVRHEEDLAFREEFEALEKSHPDFHYLPVVTRPKEKNWPGESRRIQSVLTDPGSVCNLDGYLDAQKDHVFLCGNPMMIKSVSELFLGKGFKRNSTSGGTLHFEKYWK